MSKKIFLILAIVLALAVIILVGIIIWPKVTPPQNIINTNLALNQAAVNAITNSNVNSPTPAEPNVKIDNLKSGDTISTPLTITGQARGWYFEGSFPVKLLDANQQVLAQAPAEAQSDWMTKDWVPFKVTLNFVSPQDQDGTLVFMNDNPSGRPELQEKYELPVKIKATQTMTLKVYFGNSEKNPNAADCSLVYPVDRVVAKTVATAQAALGVLLKGPTSPEIAQKYYTSIPDGVVLNKVTITNGTATADFNETLNQVAGSCRVTAIRAQIEQTLKQFPTVKNVVITINGRTGDILQP